MTEVEPYAISERALQADCVRSNTSVLHLLFRHVNGVFAGLATATIWANHCSSPYKLPSCRHKTTGLVGTQRNNPKQPLNPIRIYILPEIHPLGGKTQTCTQLCQGGTAYLTSFKSPPPRAFPYSNYSIGHFVGKDRT